ncbi:MAG: cytochrome C [Bacteroidetes bacterium]|nr:cytochrome C [Bacteroidota bacterium]MBU1114344.1 cytochrome C [Bacteroidota bacterium]MBU1797122.1 cytochrome C [Bacteroidota bacterium]
MKLKYYILIFIVGVLYLSLSAFSFNSEVDSTNKDIIKFSHQFHSEQEVMCADCHSKVENSVDLNERLLPTMATCANCHDVEDENECSTCHYDGVQVPFPAKNADLYFSHKAHLGQENVSCAKCHSGLNEVDFSFESPKVFPVMETCNECHSESGIAKATNFACESCHISSANLIPDSHKKVSFKDMHKFSSMEADANCQMCHDNNFCESCHVGTNMINENNGADNFYQPYSPHNYIDNTKQQQITRVHDLNYQYNHGIDAKGKTSNCITCHQTETFCAECHNAAGNGDFAQEGFIPSTHTKSDFTTFGVGSGGGLHAELAKRDIERCAACHDTQGTDPTCIMCHTDNDGIKGTNPRTHEIGFMRNEEGNWHGDFGAVCYNCHTDAGALSQVAGQGFCGYCHSSNPD